MSMLLSSNVRFPNLGIELNNVPTGIDVFGYTIAFYGVLIAMGMLFGVLMAQWMAKRTGQNPEFYLDFALFAIPVSVVCTRLYYVAFEFDQFKDNLWSIFNLRTGGLAIYGGIIGAVLSVFIYTKVKKYSFGLLADTGVIGLLIGQVLGRWGNFFNKEAFGKYTDGLFAMQLDLNAVSYEFKAPISYLETKFAGKEAAFNRIIEIRDKVVAVDGINYIQVHPTFLYESLWNIVLMILLILYTKHKKFNGEVILLYLAGYGLGRVWIEGLRTDQLFLWGSPLAVSQVLSAVLVVVSFIMIIILRRKYSKKIAN